MHTDECRTQSKLQWTALTLSFVVFGLQSGHCLISEIVNVSVCDEVCPVIPNNTHDFDSGLSSSLWWLIAIKQHIKIVGDLVLVVNIDSILKIVEG